MKQGRCSAALLLLAIVADKCVAVPLNSTVAGDENGLHGALMLPRMEATGDGLDTFRDIGDRMLQDLHASVADLRSEQRIIIDRYARQSGWRRIRSADGQIPEAVRDLTGFTGTQGDSAEALHMTVLQPREWRSLNWQQDVAYYAENHIGMPATGWAYEGIYNAAKGIIIVPKAYSPELNVSPLPRPSIPDHRPPGDIQWSDAAFAEHVDGKLFRITAPRLIYFPRVHWGSEDAGLIQALLEKTQQDLQAKPGISFPIGSYGHSVLLGTEIGMNVGRFLATHKGTIGITTVVSIHVWDSGDQCNTPAIAFSCARYDDLVEEAERKNRAHQGYLDYPSPLKIEFEGLSS